MPADRESEAGGEPEPGEGARAAERRRAGHGEGVRRGAGSGWDRRRAEQGSGWLPGVEDRELGLHGHQRWPVAGLSGIRAAQSHYFPAWPSLPPCPTEVFISAPSPPPIDDGFQVHFLLVLNHRSNLQLTLWFHLFQ